MLPYYKRMVIRNYLSLVLFLECTPQNDFKSTKYFRVENRILKNSSRAKNCNRFILLIYNFKKHNNGWGTEKAYTVSRSIVTSTMASNNEIEYLIDLHRDSSRRDLTTATIHNKPYARVFFVVGSASDNHEKSLAFANKIHKSLESQYPGISRGIFEKGLNEGNGVYNQDLSEHSILIEIGGVDNNMKEIKNTVDALAKVISQYFWDAEKVNSN